MNKKQFMHLLGQAYHFPDYYGHNLDAADEILAEMKEETDQKKLSLQPLLEALLSEEPEVERSKIWALLCDHFSVE